MRECSRAASRYMCGCLLVLGAMMILPTIVSAKAEFEPVFQPTLSIDRAEQAISVDGQLDDSGWIGATRIESFVERFPGDNTQPAVPTTTLVTYDDDRLYVAFVCVDEPQSLRSTMCQRDQFHGDDAVGVLIDTYGEAAWAYQFFVNPHGIQKDHLWSTVAGEDPGFDLIWESAAHVTDSGYQVEIAVPFSSLRFSNKDVQSWKMDFWRIRPRESNHEYSWAAYDRNENCWPCQWGTVEGMRQVVAGRGLEILPGYVANQAGRLADGQNPQSGFREGDVYGEFSIGGKFSVSSDVTLEAAYNPDFSQIEADAAQVDVNTTIALFYPERRPFFQEGSDVFRTLFNSFYTRTVNDPKYAAKVVSRKQGLTLGFMSAQDENTPYVVPFEESSEILNTGRSYVNVLRGSRSVGDASQLGFIVTDRRFEGGGYGTIVGIDGDIRLTPTIGIDGQFLSSWTGEQDDAGVSQQLAGVSFDGDSKTAIFDGESFRGNAFISRIKRFARHWSFMVDFNQVEPSYRTQTGYDPWVDYRNASFWTQYTFYPESGVIQRLTPQFRAEARWRFDGARRWEHQYANLDARLRWAQTYLSIFGSRGSESWTSRVRGVLVDYDKLFNVGLNANSRFTQQVGLGVSVQHGRTVARFADAVGNETSANLSVELKPADRVILEPDISFVRSTDIASDQKLFEQFIVRTRLRLQVNRQLSVRFVVQYDDSEANFYVGDNDDGKQYFHWASTSWDIDPLVTYRLSPFSVIYAGSTHNFQHFSQNDQYGDQWKLGSRQFFVKLQYLLQI